MNGPGDYQRRIAYFGGSFDPPHKGHLAIARAAQTALDLDLVLFAPVGAQPLKPHGATATFSDRLAMARLAIANDPSFEISLADASANGSPNYTIDALLRLRAELPAGSTLFCLMGADSLLSLSRWHRAAEIPFAAHLIVASRPGQPLGDLTEALPGGLSVDTESNEQRVSGIELRTFTLRNATGDATPFYLLPGLHVEISASEIRSQMNAALGCLRTGHDLLPDAVCEYIATHNLYRRADR
jgi:nicotinate-nucleotide adenylyltransferase